MSLLNTLEGYQDFVSSGRTGLGIHRFVEALKCKHHTFYSAIFLG